MLEWSATELGNPVLAGTTATRSSFDATPYLFAHSTPFLGLTGDLQPPWTDQQCACTWKKALRGDRMRVDCLFAMYVYLYRNLFETYPLSQTLDPVRESKAHLVGIIRRPYTSFPNTHTSQQGHPALQAFKNMLRVVSNHHLTVSCR